MGIRNISKKDHIEGFILPDGKFTKYEYLHSQARDTLYSMDNSINNKFSKVRIAQYVLKFGNDFPDGEDNALMSDFRDELRLSFRKLKSKIDLQWYRELSENSDIESKFHYHATLIINNQKVNTLYGKHTIVEEAWVKALVDNGIMPDGCCVTLCGEEEGRKVRWNRPKEFIGAVNHALYHAKSKSKDLSSSVRAIGLPHLPFGYIPSGIWVTEHFSDDDRVELNSAISGVGEKNPVIANLPPEGYYGRVIKKGQTMIEKSLTQNNETMIVYFHLNMPSVYRQDDNLFLSRFMPRFLKKIRKHKREYLNPKVLWRRYAPDKKPKEYYYECMLIIKHHEQRSIIDLLEDIEKTWCEVFGVARQPELMHYPISRDKQGFENGIVISKSDYDLVLKKQQCIQLASFLSHATNNTAPRHIRQWGYIER